MDVVLDEVDKEVTKVKKLVKEVNEGLVLVYIHGDGQRGYHKVVQNDLVLNKEVDVEVNQEVGKEVDKEVANVVKEQVVSWNTVKLSIQKIQMIDKIYFM